MISFMYKAGKETTLFLTGKETTLLSHYHHHRISSSFWILSEVLKKVQWAQQDMASESDNSFVLKKVIQQ